MAYPPEGPNDVFVGDEEVRERIPTVDPEQVAALERAADGKAPWVGADRQEVVYVHGDQQAQLDRLERMLRHTMYLVSVLAKIARVQPEELQAAHEVALQAEQRPSDTNDKI